MAHKSRKGRRDNETRRREAELKQAPVPEVIQQARSLEKKANYVDVNPAPPTYLDNNKARKPHMTPSSAGHKIPFFMLGQIGQHLAALHQMRVQGVRTRKPQRRHQNR